MPDTAVTIVDYGMGNLLSVRRAFERCGARVSLTRDPSMVVGAERLVVPGVGAFADCMAGLRLRNLIEPVKEFAATGRPLLGICVGMQILLEIGEEFGECDGLGLIPGRVAEIPRSAANGQPHKIPHIGWTPIHLPHGCDSSRWSGTILEFIKPDPAVYFVHSFTAQPRDASARLADSDYGGRLISAAIQNNNISGTQFHPEKSGAMGLEIVRGFMAL